MLTREHSYEAGRYSEHRARAWTMALLHAASRVLDSLAARLALAPATPASDPLLEFHAEAGAPEGALYVDGQLVGHVVGVNRL